jgi:integrase
MTNRGRPQKPVGGLGNIMAEQDPETKKWLAWVYVRESDGRSRRVQRSGRTAAIAKAAVESVAKRRGIVATGGGISQSTTISQLVDHYLEAVAENTKWAAQTKSRYAHTADVTIRAEWPDVKVSELHPGTVANYLEKLARTNLAEARMVRTVLRAVLQPALRAQAVSLNAAANAAVLLEVPFKNPRALAITELERLRELVAAWRTGPGVQGPRPTADLVELIDVMLSTGARISEVLAIRVADVYISDDEVSVDLRGTIVHESGVGTRRQDTTKTGSVALGVPLTRDAALAVRRRALYGSHELLFVTKKGTPFQQQNLARQLRAIVAGTELEWVTSHVFRKTAGTVVFEADGLTAASQFLRHSNEKITERSYVQKGRVAANHTQALEALTSRPRD